MELFRPVSAKEYEAIEGQKFEGFPKCPHGQQLFTALLSEYGAKQIARHLKLAQNHGNMVYVLRFMVEDAYIRQYPVQNADDPEHQVIWIDAEEMNILNQHLVGKINVVETYNNYPEMCDTFFA